MQGFSSALQQASQMQCILILLLQKKKNPSRFNITAAAATTLRICLAATWLTVASCISSLPSVGALEIR